MNNNNNNEKKEPFLIVPNKVIFISCLGGLFATIAALSLENNIFTSVLIGIAYIVVLLLFANYSMKKRIKQLQNNKK